MWSEKGRSVRREKNAVKEVPKEKSKEVYIPEASVYDEEPVHMSTRGTGILQKSVTVFGYSPSNLEHVLEKFSGLGEIKEMSHGKNWMDIQYKRDGSMFMALQESGIVINGEMIGVVQRARKSINMERIEKSALLVNKNDGLIGRVLTYLFG